MAAPQLNEVAKDVADIYIGLQVGDPSPNVDEAISEALRLFMVLNSVTPITASLDDRAYAVAGKYVTMTGGNPVNDLNGRIVQALTAFLTVRGKLVPKDFNELIVAAALEYIANPGGGGPPPPGAGEAIGLLLALTKAS
jgi:hypothetical protein